MKEINLSMESGIPRTAKVAKARAGLVIHRAPYPGKPAWNITHVGSGLALAQNVRPYAAAKALLDQLVAGYLRWDAPREAIIHDPGAREAWTRLVPPENRLR